MEEGTGCRIRRLSGWGGRDLEKGEFGMGRSISGTVFPLSRPKAACGRLFTATQREQNSVSLLSLKAMNSQHNGHAYVHNINS